MVGFNYQALNNKRHMSKWIKLSSGSIIYGTASATLEIKHF